jgi:hypothetical protein
MSDLSVRGGECDVDEELVLPQPVKDRGNVLGVVVPLETVLLLHGWGIQVLPQKVSETRSSSL